MEEDRKGIVEEKTRGDKERGKERKEKEKMLGRRRIEEGEREKKI